MSKNLEGIVAKIRDVRAQKRPEIETNLQKIDALLAALRDTRGRASAVAARYPDLATALQGVSFNDAENRLLEARAACEAALTRLRRDSINIGVAAKAGQGKSQMLQMLTGLGSDQIPTGGGGACTAVRSIVHNSSTKKAVVHYLTPAELLEKKVYPSYAPAGSTPFALGLSGKPTSLEGFLSASLSTVDSADNLPTQGVNNWNDNVIPLQRALNAHPDLKRLLGNAPEEIPMEEVRTYLVKDNDETRHNVVSFVELWTPFEVGLPEGLTVYDIPGLEDPTPGIREDMLESVKNDADVVFFLLKPPTNGERTLWGPADNNATDMLKSVYPLAEVKPQDWIQLILNEDKRNGHQNGGSINLLLGKNADGSPSETLTSRIPKDFSPVVCDCGSKDAVRDMVDANIDALVTQTGKIDDLRISQAGSAFSAALGEVRALYDALRNASGDIIAQESGFNFQRHLLTFMAELRGPFKKDLAPAFREMVHDVLARHFKAAETKFGQLYDKNADAKDFPPELPVFSKTRIKEEFDAGYGPAGVVEKTVRNQREAVLKLLRDQLTECCAELVARYYDCVIGTGFNPNPALNRIASASEAVGSSKERLERFLSAVRANGSYASLETAVEGLLRFELSFDETVLPAIYGISDLDDFNPELPKEAKEEGSHELDDIKNYIGGLHDSEKQTEDFYNWLRMKSESILGCITSGSASSPLAVVSEHVANTMRANYDAFVFRFIWGDTTENEWRRFADHNKAVFWKDEFDAASANSKLAQDWQAALSGLAAAL